VKKKEARKEFKQRTEERKSLFLAKKSGQRDREANELDVKSRQARQRARQQTRNTKKYIIIIIMDPYYKALSLFRLRRYEQCIEICNQLLNNSPQMQGPWELKMRAMTQRVYVDDIEAEDDGVVGS
jgi:hypothetical protein